MNFKKFLKDSNFSLLECLVTQSCLTLCNPMDYILPFPLVHGILQARILEWVPISSSRGSSLPRDRTHILLCLLHWQAGSLPLELPGKPVGKKYPTLGTYVLMLTSYNWQLKRLSEILEALGLRSASSSASASWM